MKKVLVVYYSQSGELADIIQSIVGPLKGSEEVEIVWEELQPAEPYPFPWPFLKFMDAFPESVCMDPPAMKPVSFDPKVKFDLILLGYQVWFLSPSLPMTAFLKSAEASVMKGVPVITVVNCRDKWLMAQERVREHIERNGGILTDHAAFLHQGSQLVTLITTLRWLWGGKKGSLWGVFPPAGVSDRDIRDAERFGKAIRRGLESGEIAAGRSVFRGLGAVKVTTDIIQQEKGAYPNFMFWGRILKAVGRRGQKRRLPFLLLFSAYLGCLIALSLPLGILFKAIINPLRKEALLEEIKYYEQPSGSSTERLHLA